MINLPDNIKLYIKNIYVFLTYMFAFSLPFGVGIAKVIIFIWFIFWLLNMNFFQTEEFRQVNRLGKIIFIFFIVYYLLHFISLFFTHNLYEAFRNISIKLYLILIPIALITTASILKKHYYSVLDFFVLGNFFNAIMLIIIALYNSLHIINGKLIFNAAINQHSTFFSSIASGGNYFFYSNFSKFYHPSYLSVLVLFAIIILIFSDRNTIVPQEKLHKILTNKKISFLLILFFTLIILFLSSKANFIALSIVLIGILFTVKIKIFYKISLIIFAIIFSIVLINKNPRFNIYEKYVSDGTFSHNVVKTGTYRYFIWKKSVALIEQNFWTGIGIGNVNDILVVQNDNTFLHKKHNVHNEFIENFLRLGIFGGLIFLSIFVLLFFQAIRNKNKILFFLILVISTNYMFESMLDRISGTLFFGFFIFFLILYQDSKNNKNIVDNKLDKQIEKI